MVDHDLEVLPFGQVDQLFGLVHGRSERLLYEHMFPMFKSRFGQPEMRPDWSNDGHQINPIRRDKLTLVGGNFQIGVRSPNSLERFGALVAHELHFAAVELHQISDYIGSPITESDDTDSNHMPPRKITVNNIRRGFINTFKI